MTTSENDSNSETRRSLGLLAAAIVFFGAILWWKSDQIFGDPKPVAPQVNGGNEAGQQKPEPFKPVRNEAADAATIEVTVRAKDGKRPLADARVLAMTRTRSRPSKGRVRGFPARSACSCPRARTT